MTYKCLLTLLGLSLAFTGAVRGGWFLVLVWLGCNFLLLGVAHSRKAHRVFGKRTDGTLPLWSWLLFLPLLSYTLAVWHLVRIMSREPACTKITEQLVVGRRLISSEVDGEFDNYVDLTAEFPEPLSARQSIAYSCFPILDAATPKPESLCAVVLRLRPGRTFVHCAQGHGRTGLFAAILLLTSGTVRTVDEALDMLQSLRPGIRLNKDQLGCVRACANYLASRADKPDVHQHGPVADNSTLAPKAADREL